MAITGWGNFRPLSALSVDRPLPAPPGLRAGRPHRSCKARFVFRGAPLRCATVTVSVVVFRCGLRFLCLFLAGLACCHT